MAARKSEKSKDDEKKSFWTTLPGVLTAITTLITAIAGLIAAINAAAGMFNKTTPIPSPPTIAASPTFTPTFEPQSATSTDAVITTVTKTYTPTPPLASYTPTPLQAFSLPICIYVIDSNVNVREGPGTNYARMGQVGTDGSQCPVFSARIVNREQEVWFQFAPDQKAEFQQYAGRWISGSSLAAFDLPKPLPLPICIYNSVEIVHAYILPSVNAGQRGDPIKADGTNCPFFVTRIDQSGEVWYQFSSNQKGNEDFQQYAGIWLREDSLVVETTKLPIVTLTPPPAPLATDTSSP